MLPSGGDDLSKKKKKGKSKANTSRANSSKQKEKKVKTAGAGSAKAGAEKGKQSAAAAVKTGTEKAGKASEKKNSTKAASKQKTQAKSSGAKQSEKAAGKKGKGSAEAKTGGKKSAARDKTEGKAVREKHGSSSGKGRRAYYRDLDILRALACVGVLLYHLGILKGGYLAVCTFFVLSGYLSTLSAAGQEKFSLKNYYLRRLRQIYLPLAAVALITVLIVSVIPKINWLNLKPETRSVLLGYNNWWQLDVSLDYFARHVSSPFMHFWYVAIQIQFDLVFPLLYIFLEKIREKEGKPAQYLLLALGIFLSSTYMILLGNAGSVMPAYYDTFSRVNALLAGVLWGFLRRDRSESGTKQRFKNSTMGTMFWCMTAVWIAMMIFCSPDSGAWAMILTVPVSLAIIESGTRERPENAADRVFGYVSGLSYEVYLVQYPVIYLLQELFVSGTYISPLIKAAEAAVTAVAAVILRAANSVQKGKKNGFLKIAALCLVAAFALGGAGMYAVAEDHTKEMKELEAQLEEISAGLEQRQAELLERRKQEETDWEQKLAEMQDSDEGLAEIVRQLPIVGIGDSVMLGALPALYSEFPNGYFDADKSRTTYVADSVVTSVENMGLMGDVVVFNFGANGEGPDYLRENVVNRLSDKKVFWITNTNSYMLWVNDDIKELAQRKDNLYVIDWYEISRGHEDYFFSDEIHLTETGQKAFADAVYESIFEVYKDEWQKKIDAMIADHEAQELKKVTFYGNDLLTGVYPRLDAALQDSEMVVTEAESEEIVELIRQASESGELTHRIVLAFDSSAYLTAEEYAEILEICSGHDVSIVSFDVPAGYPEMVDVSDIAADAGCFMPDMIHLSETGNERLAEKLSNRLTES